MSEPGGTSRHLQALQTMLPGPPGKGHRKAVPANELGLKGKVDAQGLPAFSEMQVKNEGGLRVHPGGP